MNLPNCPSSVNGDRTSVNDDGELRFASSGLGESNGGGRESPRALPAADRSSKVPHIFGGRSVSSRRPRRSWLVGKCCWGCDEPVPAESTATKMGRSHDFPSLIAGVLASFRRRQQWGCDGRLPSFRSVPSTASKVAGVGRNRRVNPAGLGWVSGSNGSKTLSFSLSKMENPFPSFPVIQLCPFTFFFSLIQIKLHSDP